MPTVTCHCGQKLKIREDKLGERILCPTCKKMIVLEFWNCLECNAKNPDESDSCHNCETVKPEALEADVSSQKTSSVPHEAPVKANSKPSDPMVKSGGLDPVEESVVLRLGNAAAQLFGSLSVVGVLIGGLYVLLSWVLIAADGYEEEQLATVIEAAIVLASSISFLMFSAITIAVLQSLRTLSKIEHKLNR